MELVTVKKADMHDCVYGEFVSALKNAGFDLKAIGLMSVSKDRVCFEFGRRGMYTLESVPFSIALYFMTYCRKHIARDDWNGEYLEFDFVGSQHTLIKCDPEQDIRERFKSYEFTGKDMFWHMWKILD